MYVPIAWNCWLVNCAIFPFSGRIVMEDNVASWTLTVVLPLIEPEVAEIVREPRVKAAANPPGLIDAMVSFEDAQVTVPVMSCVLPSENVPVAVNCWTVPRTRAGFAGVMAIETRIAWVTVRVLDPDTPDSVALMVAEPVARLLAKPEPVIVATPLLDEAQAAEAVMSFVDPSRYLPVAVNC